MIKIEARFYPHIMTYLHDRLRTVQNLHQYAYEGTEYASFQFVKFFKKTYFTRNLEEAKNSDTRIGIRSGKLYRSIEPVVKKKGRSILGGLSWGGQNIPYAFVHINRKRKTPTYIYPVTRKYLTLPFGINEYRKHFKYATDMPYAVFRNKFIGTFDGRDFVPYFLLRESTRPLSKVGVDEVMAEYRPIFMRDVYEYVKNEIRKNSKKRKK